MAVFCLARSSFFFTACNNLPADTLKRQTAFVCVLYGKIIVFLFLIFARYLTFSSRLWITIRANSCYLTVLYTRACIVVVTHCSFFDDNYDDVVGIANE